MKEPDILRGYAEDAHALIGNFEGFSTADVLAPVAEFLPRGGDPILDIGAGTGRDAAWFAERGHEVTAVEPVAELRDIGRSLHPSPAIDWIDDRLPGLHRVTAAGELYDWVLCIAVWQHLPPRHHETAIQNIARLCAPGGRVILSIRHGPGSPKRPCFAAAPGALIAWAGAAGLIAKYRCEAPSIQQKNRDAGVTWTWLCLDRI